MVGVPGAAMLVVAAACPPGTLWRVEALGYDTLSYHLQIPREWVTAGGMVELEHNVYSYLPGLMESAFAGLMVMRGSLAGLVEAGGGVGGVGGAGGICVPGVPCLICGVGGGRGGVGGVERGRP